MTTCLKILKIFPNKTKKYKQCVCRCPICHKEYILRYSTALRSKYGCHECYVKKLVAEPNATKHGLTNAKIYKCWQDMKARCCNPNKHQFVDWGGRGITVCEEWENNFMSFYEWALNNGYKEGLTIDRIDVNKGYYPNNCRWVSRHTQSANRRIFKNNKSGFSGVCYRRDSGKWRASININNHKYNIGVFNTAKEAAIARDLFIIQNKLTEYLLQVLKNGE